MRACVAACVPVLATARHAGRAHAAARARRDQGPRPPPAREGRSGAHRAPRRPGRYASSRALRARRHRPHGAVHAGAAGFIRAARYDARSHRDRSRRPAVAGRLGERNMSAGEHLVTTLEQLEALYGQPYGPSLVKEIDHISPAYRKMIELAPFVAIATGGPEGLDCSPKGDAPGFVRILDDKTLAIPDRPGNNRIDGM